MSEPFIGQIQAFGFNYAPRDWAPCNGQLMQISQNPSLFALLNTFYGGDGRTTFALPDLRGRMPMHMGSGPGLTTRVIGQKLGYEHVTLNVQNMPSHTHTPVVTTTKALNAYSDTANVKTPAENYLATAATEMYKDSGRTPVKLNDNSLTVNTEVQIENTGGSQGFSIMNPVQVVNYCIALIGIFPSRN